MKFQTERMVIFALLILVAYLALSTCFKKVKQNETLQNIVESKTDTIYRYKDIAGNEHAQKQVAEADIALLKAAYTKELDSVTKLLQIKDRQLQAVTAAGLINSGSITPKIDTVWIDSSKRFDFHLSFNDKWMSLSGVIGPEPVINYQLQDSILITTFYKKTGFLGLGKRQLVIDGYSLNPNVRFTGLTGLRVPSKEPGRFSLGPYLGYGYSNGRWAPSAGIALNYSLIRF